MATYRLQPAKSGKYFILLCVVVALAAAAPSAVLSLVSHKPKPTDPLVIGNFATEWDIPVPGIECSWDPNGTAAQAVSCDGISVQSNWVKDVEDSDHSLRRAVRSNYTATFTHDPIFDAGHASVMVLPYDNLVAMSIRGSGEFEGEEYQVLLQGAPAKLSPLANQVWDSFHDHPLPIDLPRTFEAAQQHGSGGYSPDMPELPGSPVPALNAQAQEVHA